MATSWARRSPAERRRAGTAASAATLRRRPAPPRRRAAGSRASATSCGRSCSSMWPVRGATCRTASGSAPASCRLCRTGVSSSLVADQDLDGDPGERRQLRALVVPAECGVEDGEGPHGGRVHDLRAHPHHLVGRVRAVEEAPDRPLVLPARRRRQLPQPLDEAGAAQRGGDEAGGQPADQPPGRGPGLGGQVAGGGGDQQRAAHPVAEQLGPGRGQAHDRHAAHRVAGEDDGAAGRDLVQHAPHVQAEPVDGDGGRVVVAGCPGRAPVAALVVADQPQVARGDAGDQQADRVVPRGLRERPAVGEDEGHRGVVGAVDRGVQQRAVVGPDGGGPPPARLGDHAATSGVRSVPGVPT